MLVTLYASHIVLQILLNTQRIEIYCIFDKNCEIPTLRAIYMICVVAT